MNTRAAPCACDYDDHMRPIMMMMMPCDGRRRACDDDACRPPDVLVRHILLFVLYDADELRVMKRSLVVSRAVSLRIIIVGNSLGGVQSRLPPLPEQRLFEPAASFASTRPVVVQQQAEGKLQHIRLVLLPHFYLHLASNSTRIIITWRYRRRAEVDCSGPGACASHLLARQNCFLCSRLLWESVEMPILSISIPT